MSKQSLWWRHWGRKSWGRQGGGRDTGTSAWQAAPSALCRRISFPPYDGSFVAVFRPDNHSCVVFRIFILHFCILYFLLSPCSVSPNSVSLPELCFVVVCMCFAWRDFNRKYFGSDNGNLSDYILFLHGSRPMVFGIKVEWHAFLFAQTVQVYVCFAGIINRDSLLFFFLSVPVRTLDCMVILSLGAKTIISLSRKWNQISGQKYGRKI